MGEIANDIIEGFSCSWCGVYFEKEHGHPVVCEDCWNDATPKQRSGFVKAYYEEL